MRRFDEVCREVGYDRRSSGPEVAERWDAYKNGEVKFFETEKDARNFSSMVEELNLASARKKFRDQQAALERIAVEMFKQELRAEYSEFTDDQYAIIYAKAYEDGHSNGYDEVAYAMSELADFANALLKTTR
jgi:flagellar biosynthesis/type III secretory pathway protein FliH